MPDSTRFDRNAYLSRIGAVSADAGSEATLRILHEKHLAAIPFENIDVRLGRPIRLDIDSLQRKLVRDRRGGYCFEQNGLFAEALSAIGFSVGTLEARVRPEGATAPLPRTHMVLRVEAGGRSWLADVGFGGDGPLWPIPLDGETASQPGGAYRVDDEGGIRVLRILRDGGWRDLYAFGLEPAFPIDFEVANHYTSTWPGSPFVQRLTVQRSTREARHVLRGTRLSERRGETETGREIDAVELPSILRGVFALDVSDEEARRALG